MYIFIKVLFDNYLTIWLRFHFFSMLHILVPQCMYMYMKSMLRSRRPLVTYQLIAFVKCNRVEENTVLNQTDIDTNKCLRFRNCLWLQVKCSFYFGSISWNSITIICLFRDRYCFVVLIEPIWFTELSLRITQPLFSSEKQLLK